MKIEKLEISNFRGIKTFSHSFGDKNLVCLVGQGNTTKSTILDAISLCFTSRWGTAFSDSDFYESNIEETIEISATVSEFRSDLYREGKFNLYIRQFDSVAGEVIDDEVADDSARSFVDTITIKLRVDSTLEPEWSVISNNLDPKPISFKDRELFGVVLISDYSDSHLSWARGGPLHALQPNKSDQAGYQGIVLRYLRQMKNTIAQSPGAFNEFEETVKRLNNEVNLLGVGVSDLSVSLDTRYMLPRTNAVSLHSGSGIPFNMEGKGAKRLTSIAAQILVASTGEAGLVLVDEIEQGLEPHRVKHLVRLLQSISKGQVFITSHSRDVVEELEVHQIHVVDSSDGVVGCSNKNSSDFQGLYRFCPDAIYAKRIILCEGRTEVGIVRMIDKSRIDKGLPSLSSSDVVCVCGGGDPSVFKRATRLAQLKKEVLVLCDNDRNASKPEKQECIQKGVEICDWDENMCLEDQLFNDLDEVSLGNLIEYAKETRGASSLQSSIANVIPGWDGEVNAIDWVSETRAGVAKLSTDNEGWFKRVDHGEAIGKILMDAKDDLPNDKRLKSVLLAIDSWIDNQQK